MLTYHMHTPELNTANHATAPRPPLSSAGEKHTKLTTNTPPNHRCRRRILASPTLVPTLPHPSPEMLRGNSSAAGAHLGSNVSSACDLRCAPELNDGDTAFMIACTTFVVLQSFALGLAQAGIIRRKNALSMLMQTITGFAIGSLLWFSVGFSLTFGPTIGGHGLLGSLKHSFLLGVGTKCCYPNSTAKTIPGVLFAMFQLSFATMAPIIPTGAWAERMEFEAFLVFTVLWPFFVYYPLAHWVWNTDGILATWGVLDFAGGLTIHTSTGVAALAVTSLLQGRLSHGGTVQHHSLPLFIVGGALIWAGWYSFNGGSAYAANGQAAVAVMNTQISSSSGALTWIILNKLLSTHDERHKWRLSDIMNGAFAGLAAVTPGSGFMEPYSAFGVGIVGAAGALCWVNFVKPRMGLDDALDVAALQGVPGILGSLAVGFVAETYLVNDSPENLGILAGGNGVLLWKQTIGVIVTVVWTGMLTSLLLLFMRRFVGIDVSPEAEEKGLDAVQVGEQAYDETLSPLLDLGHDVLAAKLIDACRVGDLRRCKELIGAGAEPDGRDYDGRTPLHLAAAQGHVHIVEHLHSCFHVDLNAQDRYGNTPLADAIRHDKASMVSWLRRRGGIVIRSSASDDVSRGASSTSYYHSRDLLQAAAEGNVTEVEWRISHHTCKVNQSDYDARTALHIAASEGHERVVRVLLTNGADPDMRDRWGLTPYASAVKFRQRATAFLLANAGGEAGSAAAGMTAATKEQSSHFQVDSNTDSTPLLQTATAATAAAGAADAASPTQLRLPATPSMSVDARALVAAAERGDVVELQRLVAKGADVSSADYDGRSALHLGAAAGHMAVSKFLIRSGAGVNTFDRFGRTPLQDAIDHGHLQLAQFLRAAGATVTNPLLAKRLCAAAAAGDKDKLMEIDLEGGNLACCDYDGRTALHLAACEGQRDVVDFLLAKGIRVTSTDRFGNMPVDDARREGHHGIASILERAAGGVAGDSTTA